MTVRYVLRRTAFSTIVLLGVLVVVFFISTAIGDPTRLILGPDASQKLYLALRSDLGLDDPIYVRFARTGMAWLQGDFGDSLTQRSPALGIVLERVPATLVLAGSTLVISLCVGVLLGSFSASHPDSLADRAISTLSLIGVSVADFWLGLMLIIVFAVEFGWFPTSGFAGWKYAILPVATLSLRPIGVLAQVSRASLLDAMEQQYPITARAKGISELRVVVKHALPNAAIAILAVAGGEAAALFNGSVVIETVFGWPGIGNLLISSIEQRDLPLIQATVVVVAVLIISINLLIDLSFGLIDPRLRGK